MMFIKNYCKEPMVIIVIGFITSLSQCYLKYCFYNIVQFPFGFQDVTLFVRIMK